MAVTLGPQRLPPWRLWKLGKWWLWSSTGRAIDGNSNNLQTMMYTGYIYICYIYTMLIEMCWLHCFIICSTLIVWLVQLGQQPIFSSQKLPGGLASHDGCWGCISRVSHHAWCIGSRSRCFNRTEGFGRQDLSVQLVRFHFVSLSKIGPTVTADFGSKNMTSRKTRVTSVVVSGAYWKLLKLRLQTDDQLNSVWS